MKLRVLDILEEKGKTKYWLYIQLGLSYQNFSKMVNNQTNGIKFENLQAFFHIQLHILILSHIVPHSKNNLSSVLPSYIFLLIINLYRC